MDWNDLRLFLSVARLGSIRAAAADLGVNQSTVNRRMDVLEHDLNLVLFDRSTRGFVLTAQGSTIAEAAAPMQAQADRVQAEAERLRRVLIGTLKLTAPHSVGIAFIAPIIEAFNARYPQVLVEYDGSERYHDIAGGEADIAFRCGYTTPDAALAVDLVDQQAWSVYCSRSFAERNGKPGCLEDLGRFPLVALGGMIGNTPQHEAFMANIDPARISGRVASVPNMRNVLHSGLGVGVLPDLAADLENDLCLCFGPLPKLAARMWLVTTHDARREPRVAAFVQIAKTWFQNRAWGKDPA